MEVKSIGQGRQTTFDNINNGSSTIDRQAIKDTKDIEVSKEVKSASKEIKEEEIKKALDKLNKFLEDDKTHAVYEVHGRLKDVMIKIIDDNTGKVIIEVPPKKILDMVADMMEKVGLLLDKKA